MKTNQKQEFELKDVVLVNETDYDLELIVKDVTRENRLAKGKVWNTPENKRRVLSNMKRIFEYYQKESGSVKVVYADGTIMVFNPEFLGMIEETAKAQKENRDRIYEEQQEEKRRQREEQSKKPVEEKPVEKKEPTRSFDTLHFYILAAENGSEDAQYEVGNAYHYGELGAEINYQEALKWYDRASRQACSKAQYELGIMYLRGEGVVADKKAAFEFFRKAAAKSYFPATTMLGSMYYFGLGVDQSDNNAFYCFKDAADLGNEPTSMYNLAFMYQLGKGTPRDQKRALSLMEQAAYAGSEDAVVFLITLYSLGSNLWGVKPNEGVAAMWTDYRKKNFPKEEQIKRPNYSTLVKSAGPYTK